MKVHEWPIILCLSLVLGSFAIFSPILLIMESKSLISFQQTNKITIKICGAVERECIVEAVEGQCIAEILSKVKLSKYADVSELKLEQKVQESTQVILIPFLECTTICLAYRMNSKIYNLKKEATFKDLILVMQQNNEPIPRCIARKRRKLRNGEIVQLDELAFAE